MTEGDKKADPRTVFVRGIAPDVTDQELSERFSGLGPVRSAFLARPPGGGAHRGFGFVVFATKEDAVRAASMGGVELAGKKVKVEVAVKRAPMADRKQKRGQRPTADEAADGEAENNLKGVEPEAVEPVGTVPRTKRPRPSASAEVLAYKVKGDAAVGDKHAMDRTIALGCPAAHALEAALALAAKEAGAAQVVTNPAPIDVVSKYKLAQDGCPTTAVLLTYPSVKDAVAAVAALHGRRVAGSPAPLWCRQVSGEGLHQKRWRLVVRNLSFKATEDDLRAVFAPAGFVWEITLPRGADGKLRGFAFVGMTCRAHAEAAIRLVNGGKVASRVVAVDWALPKDMYEAAAAGGKRVSAPRGKEKADDGGHSEEEGSSGDELEGPAGGKRHRAWQEEDDDVAADPRVERGMLQSVVDDILFGGNGSGDGINEVEDEDLGESEEEEEEEAFTAASPPVIPRPLSGPTARTIFIRGLPLDAAKEQVTLALRHFGRLTACRLVMDPATTRPSGKAFVEFADAAAAAKAAEASDRARRGEGPAVAVAGRRVELHSALGGDDARALAAGWTSGKTGDARNLVLVSGLHQGDGNIGMTMHSR
jgi:nucleolar protein 4